MTSIQELKISLHLHKIGANRAEIFEGKNNSIIITHFEDKLILTASTIKGAKLIKESIAENIRQDAKKRNWIKTTLNVNNKN